MITSPYPVVERFQEESTYNDPCSKSKLKFPSIEEVQAVHLSVVVPAYNEEDRCKSQLVIITYRLFFYY